ncbi:MAG TPA: RlmE family RNA methyltransferase [Candidatus Megaira endosymbiont of Nemacystus decipiens]|nr:RlmE family RNA methyltransferase [Candidatus Megaera endosymbiont of Nemacystus decipiens]
MEDKSSGYRGRFTKVKTAKRRKISSTKWLQRQLNDQYVQRSKTDGYKSRAAYKIIEINNKFGIFKPGQNVVDLGAAPGGWSQVVARLIKSDISNAKNKLLAIDLLPMDDISGVTFAQKDFYDDDAKSFVLKHLCGEMADVVMSDMAANTTGHAQTDHLRTMGLCEAALDFALKIIKPGGVFIVKIFRGGAENDLLEIVKQNFKLVKHFKPDSSRKASSEFYLVAMSRKRF